MDSEADQLSDFNRSSSNTTTFEEDLTAWFVSRQLFKVLLSVASIICDTLIIYAIIKLKKTQEVKCFHLMNWSVLDILYSLISPYVSFLINAVAYEELEYDGLICWILQTESALTFLILISVCLLTIDWIIGNVSESWYNFYTSKLIFIKIFFYTFAILYLWYASMYCLSNWREIHNITILNTLRFLVLYTILLHVFYYVYSKRRNLLMKMDFTIILPTTLVLCWLPYLIVHTFLSRSNNENLLIFSYFISQCFVLGNAVLNMYLLARTEHEFRKKFLEFVKCQCRDQLRSHYLDVYTASNANNKS
jgi:hypothetical protein